MSGVIQAYGNSLVRGFGRFSRAIFRLSSSERRFDYDATDTRGRRRKVSAGEKHEDLIATEQKRKILSSNARDLARNFTIARWAIGKHLDYVSRFSFQAKTGDTSFDAQLERWMVARTGRQRFDVAGRHPLRRAIRLSEACRCIDGDIGWMKIAPGSSPLDGTIQAIESDLIRTPKDQGQLDRWFNGVLTNDAGAAEAYGLHKRNGCRFEFARNVPADNLYLHAWYDFRFDQVRGVSPIVSALNWFRDTYEGFEYALAKVKVAQLFGIQITRMGETSTLGPPTPTSDADGDGQKDSDYEVDINTGPFMLDMNPGDEMKVVESSTPSAQTTDFLKLMIHVALRTLDIPFSFFDESFTNFYGSRGGLIQYLKSCKTKINDLQDLLNWWTDWALALAVFRGELILPRGMTLTDISYEWIPDGVPWWDPVKEVRGQVMAIAAGLTSPQRACRESNTEFEDNIDQIAEAMSYAKSKGVPLVFADSSAFAPEITVENGNAN